jgi:hypothetical protein
MPKRSRRKRPRKAGTTFFLLTPFEVEEEEAIRGLRAVIDAMSQRRRNEFADVLLAAQASSSLSESPAGVEKASRLGHIPTEQSDMDMQRPRVGKSDRPSR